MHRTDRFALTLGSYLIGNENRVLSTSRKDLRFVRNAHTAFGHVGGTGNRLNRKGWVPRIGSNQLHMVQTNLIK